MSSKALFLKETTPETLFGWGGVVESHLTCHKHPVCWARNKVNNLAGSCSVPSKQVVKQFCSESREPAVWSRGTAEYLLPHAELLTTWLKISKKMMNMGLFFGGFFFVVHHQKLFKHTENYRKLPGSLWRLLNSKESGLKEVHSCCKWE